MNLKEAVLLCRYVKAATPHQQMDEYTPDVWFDLLEDVTYDDAQWAVKAHLRENQFVGPSDIHRRIRVRAARLSGQPETW
jgi:hypothetical protein